MKTIRIKNIEIEEVVYAKDLPIVVRYKLLDESGNIVTRQTAQIKQELSEKSALNSLLEELLTTLSEQEGL